MTDFNGEMRRGGRGGGSFRSHSSKEPGTVGPYPEILYCVNMLFKSVRKYGYNIILVNASRKTENLKVRKGNFFCHTLKTLGFKI